VLLIVIAAAGFGAVLGISNAYVDTTPTLDLAKIENQQQTSFIYDVNGKQVTTFTGLENRIWASIDEIPPMLQNAFVAIEDERFYTHPGVDIKRIFGAFFSNLTTDKTQGGSTITQQVIKLRLLSSEQTYKRKLQEAYLALQLETQYNKGQILETYMNTIFLGSSNYGVKAAAKDYYGKELSELTIRECAMLAGTANSGYLYDPRQNYHYREKGRENTDKRTDLVLDRMYRNGFISKEELDAAKSENVHILEKSKKQQLYDMPYFLEYAVRDVITHFLRERNLQDTSANRSAIENELRTSGYHIYTTVDPTIQHTVEESLYNWDEYPKLRHASDSTQIVKNPDGSTQEIIQPQAAAAVFDYRTGHLKAIVGGREAPKARKTLNRAALNNPMPVGSSIKPLAVYGPALNKGASPGNVVLDLPLPVTGWRSAGNPKEYPSNYDGGKFLGPITIREALTRSVNVAAARILVDTVTVEESYNTLISLGINADGISKDPAGLALGTSGISPVQMAAAFGAIGNKGVYV
ncbi:MAG: penicillin-binding protein, partial [Desulfobacterales bacterium]|nr:penicillin-binding protein [Desulfobacterales bacterium]